MSRETDDALRQAIAASLADQASQDADDDLRQALEASKQEITQHVDDEIAPLKMELGGLREEVGAMVSKFDAFSAKLLEAVAGTQAGE